MGFLASLVATSGTGRGTGKHEASMRRFVGRDETTRQACLKMPLPSADVLSKLTDVLLQWSSEAGGGRS